MVAEKSLHTTLPFHPGLAGRAGKLVTFTVIAASSARRTLKPDSLNDWSVKVNTLKVI